MKALRVLLCALTGHELIRAFEPNRLYMRCLSCTFETPGFTLVDVPAPRDLDASRANMIRAVGLVSTMFVLCASAHAQSPQQIAADILRPGAFVSTPTWPAGPVVASTPVRPTEHVTPSWSEQSRELERFNENALKLQLIGGPFTSRRFVYDAGRSTRRSPDELTPRELPRRPLRRTRER